MNRFLARLLSGIVPDKDLRRKLRNTQTKAATPHNTSDPIEKLYSTVSGAVNVKSLHEYVSYYSKINDILHILAPYDVSGAVKVRIGGEGDGGYVMLEPGHTGIAYSFGVSTHSPWDLEMASRGYKVYQFDGTITSPPDEHPNLFFQKINVVSSSQVSFGAKSLQQIIDDLGHKEINDIILQIDIEGCEWDIFEEIASHDIERFSQIIIEWHGLTPSNTELERNINILKKVALTHKPIHVHMNNHGYTESCKDGLLFYSNAFEVTYARIKDHSFVPSEEEFPISLDNPNNPNWPEIVIGKWPKRTEHER